MSEKHVNQVSGHSVRVGAAQDLLALNIDLAAVMQVGRWKSTRMSMRYAEEALAAKGGMGRAVRSARQGEGLDRIARWPLREQSRVAQWQFDR